MNLSLWSRVLLIVIFLISGISTAFALSFGPDTEFLSANSKEECESIGGNYTERYEETYCTTSPSARLNKKIRGVVQKIVLVLEKSGERNGELYLRLLDTLNTYQDTFTMNGFKEKADIARQIKQQLVDHYTNNETLSGNSCMIGTKELSDGTTRGCNDGCNICTSSDGIVESTSNQCDGVEDKATCENNGGRREYKSTVSTCKYPPSDSGASCSLGNPCEEACIVQSKESTSGVCGEYPVQGCIFTLSEILGYSFSSCVAG